MTRTKTKRGGGTFRFDGSLIKSPGAFSRRTIRRVARDLTSPPGPPRRSYGRAKLLTIEQIRRVIAYLQETSRVPESDILKVWLSHHGGLRACEIARLRRCDVTDVSGNPAKSIIVPGDIAKGGRYRSVPMTETISAALQAYFARYPNAEYLAISSRAGRQQSPNAMAAWFWQLYKRMGYNGCSSHSGRRWYITEMARRANIHGGSLRDVQEAAGHARLDSTQAYIELSDKVFAMANSLCDEPDGTPSRKGSARS